LSEAPTFRAIDTDALADHLFVTFQGAFIVSRSMNDPRHMRAQLAVLCQLESVLRDPLQMTIQTLREDLPTGLPDAG
jgi:hypothetical protein